MFVAQVPWLLGLIAALLVLVRGHGIAGAGAAQAIVAVGLMVPIYLVLLRRAGVAPSSVARAVLPPLLWALLAAGIAALVARQIDNPFLATATGATAGLACYLVAHTRELRDAIAALRRDRGAGPAPGSSSGPSHGGPDGPTSDHDPDDHELADRLDEAEAMAVGSLTPGLPVESVTGPT